MGKSRKQIFKEKCNFYRMEWIDKYIMEIEKCLFEQGLTDEFFKEVTIPNISNNNIFKGYSLENYLFLCYLKGKALQFFYENRRGFLYGII